MSTEDTFSRSQGPNLWGLNTAPEGAWPVFEFKYLPHLSHLLPDDAILEVGCGPGQLLAYLASKGYRSLEGIDISAEQIEIAKAQGLRAQCADVFSFLEQRKGAYQAIIGLDFVEHFTKDEVLRLFRAMWRALKGGGVLLLQTPNGEGLFSSASDLWRPNTLHSVHAGLTCPSVTTLRV